MKRNTVSLCLIARDEEAAIGMAIKSVLALVDEVIVADTGSGDNTQLIAEGYGAQVLDVPWEDDFAEARNRALAQARGDWILILDADESLQPVRPVDFQRLLNDPGAAAYRMNVVDGDGSALGGFGNRIRLFRNDERVKFVYPVCESVEPGLRLLTAETGQQIKDAGLTVINEGHGPDRDLRQRERNLRIIRATRQSHPHEPYFSYLIACLGLSLLDDDVLPAAGVDSSLAHLRQAWADAQALDADRQHALPWLADLGLKTVSGLLCLDRVAEAAAMAAVLADRFPDHPGVVLQSVAVGLAQLGAGTGPAEDPQWQTVSGRIRGQLASLREAEGKVAMPGVDSRRIHLYPLRYEGELALLEGRVSEAVGLFEQALNLDGEYSFGWLGMAECSRYAGDKKRALKLYLRTVTASEDNYRAWLRGCDLMRELGFRDNAASWWSKVVTRFPEHPAVAAYRREPERELCPTSPSDRRRR